MEVGRTLPAPALLWLLLIYLGVAGATPLGQAATPDVAVNGGEVRHALNEAVAKKKEKKKKGITLAVAVYCEARWPVMKRRRRSH